MLETIFNEQEILLLKNIAKVANENGINIYLVGGAVRDILMGNRPKDIDIAVMGDMLHLAPKLKDRLFCKTIKAQPDLRTMTLEFRNGTQIDFASTRKEFYGIRKGMPVASHFGCELIEDVMRRDFSINAIAISLNNNEFDKIVDFVNGQEDIKNKVLRVLHDESFNDDPTRIIRAFKFAHRLGFHLDEHTQYLQDEYFNKKNYTDIVSPARIKKEMYEIFSLNNPEIMNDFINKNIYKVLSDKINNIDFFKVKELISQYKIEDSTPYIYFLSIFFNIDNYKLIRQFDLTRLEIRIIQELKFAQEMEGKFNDLQIYQQYSNRTPESIVIELLIKNNGNINKYLEKLKDIKIEITGSDLLFMGVPESKSFSDIFDRVLEEKIKGNLPDKSSELRFVRQLLLNNEV